MPNIEEDIQNEFINIVTKRNKEEFKDAYNVYQKLVYYRYEEVIKNTFIEFKKYISAKELEESIRVFLKEPCSTEFVWKIANDYRKFVKKNRLFHDRKYLYDLLYFDWIELELSMQEYEYEQIKEFHYENSYKLSNSCRLKRFDYDILNANIEKKEENFAIIYYDFKDDEVKFRQINPVLFYLLKKINKTKNIQSHLLELCFENELDFQEAKEVLYEPLSELNSNGVFFFK
ncbi:hypothetical protein CP960_10145 [Malaciobacter halophilus]|uniref:DNA-binding domain-containing protein n=1 Tax=Malaciobacter halophilus TaxID=197482 RepID=A0A2N1J1D6_9BACT|nr:hypothetical protein [Malaciobacter halophilus]AXH08520.1 hypothetical protein AHALO_0100 [Malaciobacter halophilus]PKI80302.1 hypothetical protein CP960_10145 [Malaciobacter halophilus]